MKVFSTRAIRFLLLIIGVLLTGSFGFTAISSAAPAPQGLSHRPVCGVPAANAAQCHAEVLVNVSARSNLATNNDALASAQALTTSSYYYGYTPQDIRSAYKLPAFPAAGSTFAWNGQTIGLVDAYDNPNTAQDLLAYRKQFGLPLCATTKTSPTATDLVGCLFTKINQNGQTSPLPAANIGWGQETDLDIQMAAASCPRCKILLVEANSANFTDLGVAVDRAAALKANAISNSYGSPEFSSETASYYNGHYNHPGIAITVSTGDAGYGVQFPAASQYVTAVGGTSLTRNTSTARGWTEKAWSGGGSGCSAYIAKPSWQPTIGTCTTHRIVADTSAVADPNTGVAMYDSYGSSGANWYVMGGTSAASPIIAGTYASAGNAGGSAPKIRYGEYIYAHKYNFFDVTSGSNGSCTGNYALCNATSGFDGPTGLGSPSSVAGF